MEAVTAKPSGACVTASPWDIHTTCSRSWSANSTESASTESRRVEPYSRVPVWATVPPRACAIDWKP